MTAAQDILVVEDDELVRAFLCRALTGVAGNVAACPDGRSALAVVEKQPFALILLDGLLPDTHGIELGKQLLAMPAGRDIAICFVSGMLRHPQPMHSGISALPKPLRVRELLGAAAELLQWQATAAAGTSASDRLATLDALAADLLVS